MMFLPEDDSPNCLDRSTLIVRMSPSIVMAMFFISHLTQNKYHTPGPLADQRAWSGTYDRGRRHPIRKPCNMDIEPVGSIPDSRHLSRPCADHAAGHTSRPPRFSKTAAVWRHRNTDVTGRCAEFS